MQKLKKGVTPHEDDWIMAELCPEAYLGFKGHWYRLSKYEAEENRLLLEADYTEDGVLYKEVPGGEDVRIAKLADLELPEKKEEVRKKN